MSQLLTQQPVVDGRPSQPVRLMRQPPGDYPLVGDFWKQFFIKRLSANIQPVLAPKLPVSSLDILAEMADLIVDTTRTAEIQEVPAHQPSASHETSSVVDDLKEQVQNLTIMVESFASSVNKPEDFTSVHQRGRARSRSRQG